MVKHFMVKHIMVKQLASASSSPHHPLRSLTAPCAVQGVQGVQGFHLRLTLWSICLYSSLLSSLLFSTLSTMLSPRRSAVGSFPPAPRRWHLYSLEFGESAGSLARAEAMAK